MSVVAGCCAEHDAGQVAAKLRREHLATNDRSTAKATQELVRRFAGGWTTTQLALKPRSWDISAAGSWAARSFVGGNAGLRPSRSGWWPLSTSSRVSVSSSMASCSSAPPKRRFPCQWWGVPARLDTRPAELRGLGPEQRSCLGCDRGQRPIGGEGCLLPAPHRAAGGVPGLR